MAWSTLPLLASNPDMACSRLNPSSTILFIELVDQRDDVDDCDAPPNVRVWGCIGWAG